MRLGFGLALIGVIILIGLLALWIYITPIRGYNAFCAENDYDAFVVVEEREACAKVFDENVTWRHFEFQGGELVFVGKERFLLSEPWRQSGYIINTEGLGG